MQDHYTQEPLVSVTPPHKSRWRGVIPDGHSRCSRCGEIKLLDMFYPAPDRPRGVLAYCIPCYGARRSERYHNIPSVKAGRTNSELKWKYGITIEQRGMMLQSQMWRCAICNEPFTDAGCAHVDHNHATGKVRGLLCFRCNTALAVIEDREWSIRAEEYLEKYPD